MKKVMKIITIVTAVIMLQIPAISLAEENLKPSNGKVVADIVYADMENPLSAWKSPSDIYADLTYESDGVVMHSKNTDLDSAAKFAWVAADFSFELDNNEESGAKFVASQMTGKYEIEIDMETNLTTQRVNAATGKPNAGYVDFRLGYRDNPNAASTTITSSISMFRFISDLNEVGGNSNLIRCMVADKVYSDKTVNRTDRFKIKLAVDTANKSFDYYYNGDLMTHKSYPNGGFPFNPSDGNKQMFNSIIIGTQAILDEGSYVKIYGIKVTNLETDSSENGGMVEANGKYNELPESVCADSKNVTDNIIVPSLEGVTWSSDMPDIVSESGEVNRWVDDMPVNLTGSFTIKNSANENLKFQKVYALNVKAQEDAENTVILDNTEEKEWECSKGKGEHIFENNTLTLTHKGDSDGYSAVRVLNVNIPDKSGKYETLYSANHSGVYDLEFDVSSNITGQYPADVEVGYLNPVTGIFKGVGKMSFSADSAAFEVGSKSQTILSKDENYKIKLRFDTNNKKLWAYNDGKIQTPLAGIAYTGYEYDIVNSVRVFLDSKMNIDDSLSVGNMKLTRKIDISNDSVDNLISSADDIGISMVTDTPDDISDGIKKLPEKIDGMNIVWTSDSSLVDLETGYVFKGDTPNDIVLTAKIISEGIMVSKEFYLSVPAVSDISELLETTAHLLEWSTISNQPSDDIRYDVKLPTEGQFGTEIKWTSSNPQIIGNDGIIKKQTVINKDTAVTLTAEISKNTSKITKQFDITLKHRGLSTKVLSDLSISDIYTFTLDGESNTKVSCDAILDMIVNGSGTLDIKASDGKTAATLQIRDDSVLCNGQIIAENTEKTDIRLSFYSMPDKDKIAVWADGKLAADCIPSKEEFSDISSVISTGGINVKNIDIYIDDYGICELNMQKYRYLDALGNGYVTGNLNLSTNSFLGVDVQWSFSDSIVSSSGIVTADDKHHSVDAVLTIRNSNIEHKEKVRIIVSPLLSYNLAINKKCDTGMLASSSNPLKNAFDGDNSTYFEASVSPYSETSVILTHNNTGYVNTLYINERVPSIGNYIIEYSNDGSKWTELKAGDITDINSRLITFDIVNPKYLKIRFENIARRTISISEMGVYLEVDNQKKAELDINSIDLDTTKQISGNITLPDVGRYGTDIIWISSQPSVISVSGIYKAPEYDTKVILTAYSISEGKRYEKSFEVYVKGTKGAKGGQVISGGGGSGGGGGMSNLVVLPQPPVYGTDEMPIDIPDNSATPQPTEDKLFADVTPKHWAYQYIKQLKSTGIIDGVGNGYFGPDSAVTREQFLKMLLTANNTDISSDISITEFSDVMQGAWYFDYINAAKKRGIVSGISDTIFGIGQNIKRQDMAVMIWRMIDGKDFKTENSKMPFSDDEDISEYAVDDVYKLYSLGIICGDDNNMFRPRENLTRAEASVVISAVYNIINN